MIEVSAGVVYNRDGRILICQRGEGRSNAHLWEFPGGKREAGETPEACLVRELAEELSLPVTGVQRIISYPHGDLLFHFITAGTDAQPILSEHEDARFITPRELLQYDFCPADVLTARRLALGGVRHIFWDFDGTLLDSYPAMVRACMAAAAAFRIALTPERALSLMKENLRYCCEILGRENSIDPNTLVTAFRHHEQHELLQGLPPVPFIPETLKALQAHGVKHYVATHRDLQCRELLEKAGLARYFTGYVTQEDGLPRKPAPDMLLRLMQRHGLDPAQCLMVGDRPLDTEAGCNAGIPGVLLDPEGRFPDAKCDLHISTALELANLMT